MGRSRDESQYLNINDSVRLCPPKFSVMIDFIGGLGANLLRGRIVP